MENQDFHEVRRSFVGGSDIAKLLGLSNWGTALDVYLDKTGQSSPKEENAAMRFGKILEPVVADEYEAQSGRKVRRYRQARKHPEYGFIGGHVDRIIEANDDGRGTGILECKTTSGFYARMWEDEIPLDYYAQLQWYLGVFGYKWGVLAILKDGRYFEYFEYDYNPEFFNEAVQKAIDFWKDNVIPEIPPEPRTYDDIKNLYPVSEPESVLEATSELADLVADLREINADIKLRQAKADEFKLMIQKLMQNNEVLQKDGVTLVTWKNRISSRFDSKSFKADQPEVYDKYLKQSKTRSFLLKKVGGQK